MESALHFGKLRHKRFSLRIHPFTRPILFAFLNEEVLLPKGHRLP